MNNGSQFLSQRLLATYQVLQYVLQHRVVFKVEFGCDEVTLVVLQVHGYPSMDRFLEISSQDNNNNNNNTLRLQILTRPNGQPESQLQKNRCYLCDGARRFHACFDMNRCSQRQFRAFGGGGFITLAHFGLLVLCCESECSAEVLVAHRLPNATFCWYAGSTPGKQNHDQLC